jgi:hypothetical protein
MSETTEPENIETEKIVPLEKPKKNTKTKI